jgi:transposase
MSKLGHYPGASIDSAGAAPGAYCPWAALRPNGLRGLLPCRWVRERTFSWVGQRRRLSQDDERRCPTSEALSYATMTRLMLRRLAHAEAFSDSC